MSRVEFHDLESSGNGARSRSGKCLDHRRDFRQRQGVRRGVGRRGEGHGTRRHNGRPPTLLRRQRPGPICRGASLAPGMGQLDTGNGSLRMNEVGDATQPGDVLIAPQAKIAAVDAPFRCYCRSLGNDQCCTTDGPRAKVHQMPIVGQPILCRIHAHG